MTDFDTTDTPEIHPKDAEYLTKLQDYYPDWQSIPSYASLCEISGIASKSYVKAILDRLCKVGDIIVAIVDNDFTLKTLDKENGKFILHPKNKYSPVIYPQGALEIFGVLV